MKTIFLVIGITEYERLEPIRAFLSEHKANAYKDKLNAYHQTKPQPPSQDDSDEAWDEYYESNTKWATNHPADHACDFFSVTSVTFDDSK